MVGSASAARAAHILSDRLLVARRDTGQSPVGGWLHEVRSHLLWCIPTGGDGLAGVLGSHQDGACCGHLDDLSGGVEQLAAGCVLIIMS